jgi:hypothetical protein
VGTTHLIGVHHQVKLITLPQLIIGILKNPRIDQFMVVIDRVMPTTINITVTQGKTLTIIPVTLAHTRGEEPLIVIIGQILDLTEAIKGRKTLILNLLHQLSRPQIIEIMGGEGNLASLGNSVVVTMRIIEGMKAIPNLAILSLAIRRRSNQHLLIPNLRRLHTVVAAAEVMVAVVVVEAMVEDALSKS